MEKKPGRSKDFFPLKKRNGFFPKRNGKRNENLDGKKIWTSSSFFLWWKLHRWKKKPVLVEKNYLMKA